MKELVLRHDSRNHAVDDALALLRLGSVVNYLPDQLTQAQRKLVGVARALAAEPRVVCLDEPAAGLDRSGTQALGDILRQLAARGIGLLLVDHDMGLVLTVCDTVVVLDFGRVIARGTPSEVRRDRRVVEAFLGSAARELAGATVEDASTRNGQ
jgi:ABC-type branched-subunit amino acid transport system ATPase component